MCVCMQDDDYGSASMKGFGRGDYVRHTHQVHRAGASRWCKRRMGGDCEPRQHWSRLAGAVSRGGRSGDEM